MGEGQGAVPGEVCVRRDINNVLVGPRGRAPRKNHLVKGKLFLPPSLPVPSREVQALLERQLREQSLQAETGLLQKGRQRTTTVSVQARETKELQTPCLFVLRCSTSVRCENSTMDRQARQKPIHLGHCLLPESLPSLTWARLPVKHHPSCKAFCHLSGIHLRATFSTYSFRFLSS